MPETELDRIFNEFGIDPTSPIANERQPLTLNGPPRRPAVRETPEEQARRNEWDAVRTRHLNEQRLGRSRRNSGRQ
jgi:hypothetical protein